MQLSQLEEEHSDLQHTLKETKLELEELKSSNASYRDKLRKARDKHVLLQDDYDKLQEEMEDVSTYHPPCAFDYVQYMADFYADLTLFLVTFCHAARIFTHLPLIPIGFQVMQFSSSLCTPLCLVFVPWNEESTVLGNCGKLFCLYEP